MWCDLNVGIGVQKIEARGYLSEGTSPVNILNNKGSINSLSAHTSRWAEPDLHSLSKKSGLGATRSLGRSPLLPLTLSYHITI